MIVVIEGLDGVGKTTVAKKLCSEYGFEYIKESYTDDSEEKKSRVVLFAQRLCDGKDYIYDRTTLIDDFVYNFLNKTQSDLIDAKQSIVALLSQSKIFHLSIDEDIRKKRFEERGDEFVTNDKMKQIDEQYKQFYTELKNVEEFNLTEDLESDVKRLIRRIKND